MFAGLLTTSRNILLIVAHEAATVQCSINSHLKNALILFFLAVCSVDMQTRPCVRMTK